MPGSMPSWSAEAGLLATAAAPPVAADPAVTSPGPHAPGTILVLGSKPRPALPPPSCYAALACANASGFSALGHGLPEPRLTVVSAVLGSGKDSDRHSLQAMRGLS